MSTTIVPTPTSRLNVGHARAEITPPVGIYHRMWGAARHDRATGVHRPLFGDVLVLSPLDGDAPPFVVAYVDGVGLGEGEHAALARSIADAAGVAPDRVALSYSHTHSGGLFWPERLGLPGGELIPGYLAELNEKLATAARAAVESTRPATVVYATGRSSLAANRDYWDAERQGHACGYNPDAPADDTVLAGRIVDASGQPIATLVNYACHPTTLAWGNTLISPDYVGALREVVERATGAPCVFALGACGDLGPRHGFVGDVASADRNGRQLGFAALEALTSLGPTGTDHLYAGPVVSGATLGAWEYQPQSPEREAETRRFAGGRDQVDLPMRALPKRETLEGEIADWEARQREADARGDVAAARDFGAQAERARRWIGRLQNLPAGPTFPFPFAVLRLGDAVWVTTGGEPYNQLQTELRRRFPNLAVVVSPLDGALPAAYLLPRDRYGQGLYQEEPSSLGPGCLEMLVEVIASRIAETTSPP